MSNVISIIDRKEKLRPIVVNSLNNIEGALELLDKHFISDSSIVANKLAFMKTVKGILKSREISFRVSLIGLPDFLNKKTNILFIQRKIGFSLEVKSSLNLDNGWAIYPFNILVTPAENVGAIIDKLNEAQI